MAVYRTKRELITQSITKEDTILDIGFSGQGIQEDSDHWPHALLTKHAKEVYGVDIELGDRYKGNPHYQEASAEGFHFNTQFDAIFAGDLIEHLSNPGLFLGLCRSHLKPDGRLILTTPNTFNLFNLAEKLTKREPTVNPDHTFYFNSKTLGVLLKKNGFGIDRIDYVYTLDYDHTESWKKKVLNGLYWLFSKFTDKFTETLVVTAVPA